MCATSDTLSFSLAILPISLSSLTCSLYSAALAFLLSVSCCLSVNGAADTPVAPAVPPATLPQLDDRNECMPFTAVTTFVIPLIIAESEAEPWAPLPPPPWLSPAGILTSKDAICLFNSSTDPLFNVSPTLTIPSIFPKLTSISFLRAPTPSVETLLNASIIFFDTLSVVSPRLFIALSAFAILSSSPLSSSNIILSDILSCCYVFNVCTIFFIISVSQRR